MRKKQQDIDREMDLQQLEQNDKQLRQEQHRRVKIREAHEE